MIEPLVDLEEPIPGEGGTAPVILVVDDEIDIRTVLEDTLAEEGYEVRLAADAGEAEEIVQGRLPDLVLLDIWMPGTDGMELLRNWVGQGGLPFPVVMMSGHSTIETAVEATRLGAYDYLEKPLSLDKLLLTAGNALEAARLRQENQALRLGESGTELVGDGETMLRLRQQIERLAESEGAVLILGEPGSGKEAVARALHHQSGRSGPFVPVSSAAIAPEGMEEQLFGIEGRGRGSQRPGRFEEADGGVLFLDEVADMQPSVQARLNRVLEEQRFVRVGGSRPIRVDVRVVAATNRDLAERVSEGAFRSDLYYRLNVLPLWVPSLRERVEDIPRLVAHLMDRHCRRQGFRPRTLTEGAYRVLAEHSWPGNVRELENVVERMLILSESDPIDTAEARAALGRTVPAPVAEALYESPLREAREDFERRYLVHHLRSNRGNITRTSAATGLERTHLYRKLKQLGLDPADFKPGREGKG